MAEHFDRKNARHMRVPLEGGTPEVLPPFGVPGSSTRRVSSISRDDRLLAAAGTVPGQGNDTYSKSVAIIRTASLAVPPLVLPADPRITLYNTSGPQFTPDGTAVVYVIRGQTNVDNLWLQPLDGKPGRQITQFASEQIWGFGWSPDGKKLLVGRVHTQSDVIHLRDTSK